MTFLNPFFLFGLLAIAIPIALHLFDLQRPKKMIFTNVAFLREIIQQQSSARRLKHWLILLSRILFISFLVLAFAQPIINATSSSKGNQGSNVQVYVDNSYSMQNELEQQSLLAHVSGLAQQVPNSYSASTTYRLFTNEFSGNDWQYNTRDSYFDKLTELDYNGQSRTFADVARRILSSNSKNNAHAQDVFVFSDFQKSYWNSMLPASLDSTIQWHLVPIQSAEVLNIAIDSIWLETPFIQAGKPNKLHMRIKAYGKGKRETVCKLFINDIQISTTGIEITGGQELNTSFDFTLDKNSSYKGVIRFDDSPISFDNAFYFTLNSAQEINITNLHQSGGTYLSKLYSNEQLFQLQSYSYSTIDYSKLNQSDLVVLEEYSSSNKAIVQNLKQVLAKGGNVALFPPLNEDKASWEAFLKELSISVKPTALKDSVGKQAWYLKFPDTDQPFFKDVFTDKRKHLVEMPFSVPLFETVSPGTVLLRYQQGTPFLTQIQAGKGNVFVFSGCLTDKMSSFQRHSIFVPIMYTIAFDALPSSNQLYYRTTDQQITVKSNVSGLNQVHVVKDSINWLPIQNIRDGEIVLDLPDEIKTSGFYDIKNTDSTLAVLAINYGRGESDCNALTTEALQEFAAGKQYIHILDAVNQKDFSDALKSLRDGKPLWKYCVILALLFLLVEVLLLRFLK
ncbi:BatA domain-containing protein [Cytophaga hutchinsonii]|uniref:Aerotolerance regulator N-terminal domain-containing protein n=1 Tax=Cytophaga hutchinsonii (strain ATCC 33406 / DSM 1761 / CIP 103989 / NBRC 15051 / NCIMB 9469 / D465) TaxID=269798 RepID=A0A6N4SRZ5_CYTH3|nr:BatA domain-containing protein [Cytophaga hutchinsonii]ABG59061.1 conserved hypothetical protein [Cytophaga hutchinsonii ATCC 33406]SFX37874.1 N-terminal double-transmembrane domain-containing protein [Cytophaga hutchinsonii ATCC 33406]